ncbi:PAS domain S-box protein [Nitrincola sp.]|uniref:PAS domain S-box protein n=1 Tax=Nitrincola sp. TaxID=1926584 RepID=UPI003A8FFF72
MNSKSYNAMLLIVDNTPTRLELAVEAIKACGYRVFIAQSGKEALAYANQIHPDLILLNAILSGEDGFEICRCFKANTQTCDIPIICMVPEATIEYKAKCFAAGCIDYIANPLYLEEVSFRVTTHLELATARRELRTRNSQPQNHGLAFNTDKRQLHSQVGLLSDAKALLALKRFALARIHEAAFLIDETGQLHYVNQAVCNRLGYTQEELLGLNLRVIDPSWMKGFQANDWEKHWAEMRKEGGMTFETQHLTRSGEVFPVEVTANYFEYGDNAYLLGLARDITERKRTEAELRQYREHLEQLVSKRTVALNRALEFTEGVINAIPDLLFELDKEGRHLNVWTCFPELLVSLREDMLGKTVAEVLSPEATTTVMEALAEASTSAISFGKRILIDLPTGPSWFELSVSRCPGGVTDKPHFLVLSRDISERIRAEEEICRMNIELDQRVRSRTAQLEVANNELRISELEYRSLVENLPDNVIRYNAACQIVYCNPNSLRVLCRPVEDVLGKTPTEIFPDIDETKTYQATMQQVIASGQPEQVEIEVLSLDGEKQTHQVILVAERGLDGLILGALAIGRDVT